MSAVYLLTFAAPLLIAGRLGDRFGQRRVYLVGMIVFVLAALALFIVLCGNRCRPRGW